MAYTKKLEKIARDHLRAGETLQVGVRGMSKGGTAAIAGGAVGGMFGAVGIVSGSRYGESVTREGDAQARAAGIESLPAQIVLGLTEQRLLIFGRSSLTGAAKGLVAELPRSMIRRVSGEPSTNPMRADRLTLHLDGERTLELEIVRNDGVQTFIDTFERTSA